MYLCSKLELVKVSYKKGTNQVLLDWTNSATEAVLLGSFRANEGSALPRERCPGGRSTTSPPGNHLSFATPDHLIKGASKSSVFWYTKWQIIGKNVFKSAQEFHFSGVDSVSQGLHCIALAWKRPASTQARQRLRTAGTSAAPRGPTVWLGLIYLHCKPTR